MYFLTLLGIILCFTLVISLLTNTINLQPISSQNYHTQQVKADVELIEGVIQCDGVGVIQKDISQCPVKCYTGDFDNLYVLKQSVCDIDINNVNTNFKYCLTGFVSGMVMEENSECPVKCDKGTFYYGSYVLEPSNCNDIFNSVSMAPESHLINRDLNNVSKNMTNPTIINLEEIDEKNVIDFTKEIQNNQEIEIQANSNQKCDENDSNNCFNKNYLASNLDGISNFPIFNFLP